MISKSVIFKCDESVEMKVVAMLIQKASSFKANISLEKAGRKANAKSLLGVMSLGISNLDELTVFAEGEDANLAVEEISSYLEKPSL